MINRHKDNLNRILSKLVILLNPAINIFKKISIILKVLFVSGPSFTMAMFLVKNYDMVSRY